jgi:hypothetical protein
MLAHVNAVIGMPHPDTGGVDAHVWVPAKSPIQFGAAGQRLLIQLFDISGAGICGRGEDQQCSGVQRIGEQLRRDHRRIQRLQRGPSARPNPFN